jgi:hypothetical protein
MDECGSLMKANISVNGDFSANASSFNTWPGYLGSGATPAQVS